MVNTAMQTCGVITRTMLDAIAFCPSLIVSAKDVNQIADILEAAMDGRRRSAAAALPHPGPARSSCRTMPLRKMIDQFPYPGMAFIQVKPHALQQASQKHISVTTPPLSVEHARDPEA